MQQEQSHRLLDLYHQAERRNYPVFTDFLDLYEQNIFHGMTGQFSGVKSVLFGGYDEAERQMAGFLPDAFCCVRDSEDSWKELFPIALVRIEVGDRRFADPPGHRDYLGALLSLGIERKTLGDILVEEDGACLFCSRSLVDFITGNLTQVKRSSVSCRQIALTELSFRPKTEEMTGTVASVRPDSLISLGFRIPRSQAAQLVSSGRVFINGKLTESSGAHLWGGEIISVRGLGRLRFLEVVHETKKGRILVRLERYGS